MFLKEEFVWKRLDHRAAIRFSCLHDIEENKYAVQSGDYFYMEDIHAHDFQRQFVELLLEMSHERDDWFDSLEEAIDDHLLRFGIGYPLAKA